MTQKSPQLASTPESIASYLLPIIKALDSRGVDSRELLQRAGIEEAVSNDPLARLPHDRMGEIFRLALEATGDPQFGLYASRYMLPAHIHALGSAMLASHSLMDMCLRIERFGSFLASTAEFYLDVGEQESKLGARMLVPLRPEAVDMFWSFVLRFMRHLYREDFNPLRVEIPGEDSPEAVEAYRDFFRCELSFGHRDMALYFDSNQLAEKLPTASPELARLSDQVVRDYLAKMNRDDVVSRLSRLLVANLPTGGYSKEDAAAELTMSPRTLQKKLQEAGTSWREQVDRTRYELAVSYLQSGRYSLSEITYMLGFNDTSSFSRAFKRWTGKAPGSFA
ncbi:MAG: AraC family transcriptional regulator [Halioglobus sp.]